MPRLATLRVRGLSFWDLTLNSAAWQSAVLLSKSTSQRGGLVTSFSPWCVMSCDVGLPMKTLEAKLQTSTDMIVGDIYELSMGSFHPWRVTWICDNILSKKYSLRCMWRCPSTMGNQVLLKIIISLLKVGIVCYIYKIYLSWQKHTVHILRVSLWSPNKGLEGNSQWV